MNSPTPALQPPEENHSISRLVSGMVALGILALLGQAMTMWALLEFNDEKKAWEAQETERSETVVRLTVLKQEQRTYQQKVAEARSEKERAEQEEHEAKISADQYGRNKSDALAEWNKLEKSLLEGRREQYQREKEKAQLDSQIPQLMVARDGLITESEKRREEETRLKAIVDARNQSVDELRKVMGTLAKHNEEESKALSNTRADLQKLDKTLAAAEALVQQKTSLEAEVRAKESELDALNIETTQLTKKVGVLKSQTPPLEQTAAKNLLLREQIIALQDEESTLLGKVSARKSERDTLVAEKAKLTGQVEALKTQKDLLEQAEIKKDLLASQVTSLVNEEEALKSLIKSLGERRNALDRDVAARRRIHNSINDEIQQLQGQRTSFDTKMASTLASVTEQLVKLADAVERAVQAARKNEAATEGNSRLRNEKAPGGGSQ